MSTIEIFEEFYQKPFEEITSEDINSNEEKEMFWGEDVGKELF
jgi:hypothetical protein